MAVVLASPGAPSTSRCPSASNAINRRSTKAAWPTISADSASRNWLMAPCRREAAGAGGGETVSGIGGGRFMGAFDRRGTARVPHIIAGCPAIGIKNG